MQRDEREWRGSPLDMDGVMDYQGIKEIVIESESGEEEVFRPRQREEYRSYELFQMSAYLDAVMVSIQPGSQH